MIRNGFIRSHLGVWINILKVTRFIILEGEIIAITENGASHIIKKYENDKNDDAQEWLDKIMCGEV